MKTMEKYGQSIIEVLVAVGVGAIFLVGIAAVIAPGLQTGKQVQQVETRTQLAQELTNNIRAWAGGSWNSVLSLATGTSNTYYLNTAASPFAVVSNASESVALATNNSAISYARYFYVNDVYRDVTGNVTTTISGNSYDPSTKQVTVVVALASSTSQQTSYVFYLTRNRQNILNQTSWAGGSGQSTPITLATSTYASASSVSVNASGSIMLATGGLSCNL